MLSSWLPQVYVAVFAVSAYASTYYRAGSKPFNPVLGETYECDRPDKGFRFIAEQVQTFHKLLGGLHSLVTQVTVLLHVCILILDLSCE